MGGEDTQLDLCPQSREVLALGGVALFNPSPGGEYEIWLKIKKTRLLELSKKQKKNIISPTTPGDGPRARNTCEKERRTASPTMNPTTAVSRVAMSEAMKVLYQSYEEGGVCSGGRVYKGGS